MSETNVGILDEESGGSVVYATLDPNNKSSNITLSGGNLIASQSVTAQCAVFTTIGKTSGKWQFEFRALGLGSGTNLAGAGNLLHPLSSLPGFSQYSVGWHAATGRKYYQSASTNGYWPVQVLGQWNIGVLDADSGLIGFSDGVSTIKYSLVNLSHAGGYFPMYGGFAGDSMEFNFGATPLVHPVGVGINAGLFL